jgi:hypothetical protein
LLQHPLVILLAFGRVHYRPQTLAIVLQNSIATLD